MCFKACIPQTSCLQVLHITQPCLSPMWIRLTSQVTLGGVLFHQGARGRIFGFLRITTQQISGTFTTFLNNNFNQWTFNTVTLQNIYLKVCGHYCLYFALCRSRQIGMSTIVHRFSKSTTKNDSLVKQFIETVSYTHLTLPTKRIV